MQKKNKKVKYKSLKAAKFPENQNFKFKKKYKIKTTENRMNEHIDFFLPLRIFFKTKYLKKNIQK